MKIREFIIKHSEFFTILGLCILFYFLFFHNIWSYALMDVDESIKENYIYLPNQFNVGGKHKVGEIFELKVVNKTYKYKIKGFINSIGLGSYNAGAVKVVVPKVEYNTISNENTTDLNIKTVKFKLKDGVSQSKFANEIP